MKNYKFEASRPIVHGKNMDYMCPTNHDFCDCAENVVEDGIVLCGKPAVVIRVFCRTSECPGYVRQCVECYYETRDRYDPPIPTLRQFWGMTRVQANVQRTTSPAVS